MPPRSQPPFIPSPPTPEPRSPPGHVSPPVIPANSSASPDWGRNEHPQHGVHGYPSMGALYSTHTTPYSPPGMIPAAPPGSYFIPPVALPPTGSAQAVPGGPGGGYSSNYTGFPEFPPTSPQSAGLPHGVQPTTPAAAAQAQWFGMPMQAVPATQFNAFQQPLYGGYPATWATPGVHPAALGGAYSAVPVATPWGVQTPFGPQPGLPPGFQSQVPAAAVRPPPAENPRAQHPEIKQQYDVAARADKWSEEVKYGPVLEAFIVKRVRAKLELNPLLMPIPDDMQSRPWLIWDIRFHTGQCQRGPVKNNRSWAEGRFSPATWPRVKSLRIVSKFFHWMIEIAASDPELGVTCGDVVDRLHDFMYARSTDGEYKRASREKRSIIYEWFNRNRSVEDGAPGGRMPQTLLRCDWLGEFNQWGGMIHDPKVVKEICGADLPCTFVLICTEKHARSSDVDIREQEARLIAADSARERRSRSRTRSRATSRATSRTRESYLDALSPTSSDP